jgi:hypothetical protein
MNERGRETTVATSNLAHETLGAERNCFRFGESTVPQVVRQSCLELRMEMRFRLFDEQERHGRGARDLQFRHDGGEVEEVVVAEPVAILALRDRRSRRGAVCASGVVVDH